jgi:hypothetical protein
MPFVVSQSNAINVGVFVAVLLALFFMLVSRLPDLVGVYWGLAVVYVLLIPAFAFAPFNPFRGMFSHIEAGATTDHAQGIRERRLLVAFYAPTSRRRAALLLVLLLLAHLTLAFVSRVMVFSRHRPLHPTQAGAFTFMLAIVAAVWTANFGLTVSMRKRWPALVEEGVAWPEGIAYPGPIWWRFSSFFTGRLPPFLESDTPNPPARAS